MLRPSLKKLAWPRPALVVRRQRRPLPRRIYSPANDNIIRVKVPIPVSYYFPRTVRYRYPRQLQLYKHVIRRPLFHPATFSPHTRYKMATVRVIVPKRLPYVRGSYVSLDRDSLNVHSRVQTRHQSSPHGTLVRSRSVRNPFNRTRYEEAKGQRRQARHGQLDSVGARSHGMVAEAYRRGLDIRTIADAALVARSASGFAGGFR